MTEQKHDDACGVSRSDAGFGTDLTIPDFLRNQRNLVDEKDAEIKRLRELLARYRDETPPGNQPHMIAHLADEALGRVPNV